MDDDLALRSTPPKTAEEHQYLWSAAHKAHRSWVIIGPLHAVVTNWKALAVVGLLVVWLNRPEIVVAITSVLGMD